MARSSSAFLLSISLLLNVPPVLASGSDNGIDSCLDNGIAKICLKVGQGGGICQFSLDSNPTFSYVNCTDGGRFIQQSYYGTEWLDAAHTTRYPAWPPGSGQAWSYNPVQGGDTYGNPSTVLQRYNDLDNLIYFRTAPKDWALNNVETQSIMEEWVELLPGTPTAHVHFRFTYNGSRTDHPERYQEVPAVFGNIAFDKLAWGTSNGVSYAYPMPCLSAAPGCTPPYQPGSTGNVLAGGWLALVNSAESDGMGVYVTNAPVDATYYRAVVPGDNVNSTAYFAPVRLFSITPGMVFEYDIYVRIGTSLGNMRNQFDQVRLGPQTKVLRRFIKNSPWDRLVTTANAPAGYALEGRVGCLESSFAVDRYALYNCKVGSSDYMVSVDPACEGTTPAGVMGYVYPTLAAGRAPLYRCFTGTDHFATTNVGCENIPGAANEALLGYIPIEPAAVFFGDSTDRRAVSVFDWDAGTWKASCDLNEVLLGLSKDTTDAFSHAVLCKATGVASTQVEVLSGNQDVRRTKRKVGRQSDWDYGYYKWECASNNFVSGVSQSMSMSSELHAIHCSSGAGSASSCETRVIDGGAGYGGSYGDWDYGYYKGDCPSGKVAVGVSKAPSTGKAHAILCCTQ